MNEFPNLPFPLSDDVATEKNLLKYLKASDSFTFFQEDLRTAIAKIPEPTDADSQKYQEAILTLWPNILTDALRKLKERDSRECDPKKPELSFFHAKSLGVDELHKILKAFSEFEGLLYGASPDRYRDHIMHSFRVWIVGQGILAKSLNGRLSTGEHETLQVSPEEWQCMWALVALCHDIGYPLGAIEKINRRARDTFRELGLVPSSDLRFAFQQQMLPFHDTIIRLIASKPIDARQHRGQLHSQTSNPPDDDARQSVACEGTYLTHLQNKYYLKFLKSFDNLDHGIVSSLLMSRALVYFLESDFSHDPWKALDYEDCRQFLIRREILRAIASHTCPDVYHLRFDTLAFLLYIADEIQCWGRPTFEELQKGPESLGNAEVVVEDFSPDIVSIEIKTSATYWDEELQQRTRFQIDRLHRMLRLAVDTRKLAERHVRLRFRIFNDEAQECCLELKDGRIDIREVFNRRGN